MDVKWETCNDLQWCNLIKLDTNHGVFNNKVGVYIIWSAGKNIVRVGSGNIGERLEEHKSNEEITAYPNLMVTWAAVPKLQMEGVENYLGNRLKPVIGKRFPDVEPIKVNLPWKGWEN